MRNLLEEEEIIEETIEDGPKICTTDYNPVCGVDGKTYSNECSANKVEIAYVGECGAKNAFSEPKKCTREYMPVCGADGVTYSNKCEAGEMKVINEGECKDAPKICTADYSPVCGVDGETYSNKCSAGEVEIAHVGECKTEQETNLKESCEEIEGIWIDTGNECGGISKEQCENLDGNFNECASSCRNDPNAAMCDLMCNVVCQFN